MCVESVKTPIKILAVEKNGTIRRLIRVHLEAAGLLVCEAGSEHECGDVLLRGRCRALLFSADSLSPDTMALIQKVRRWCGEELPLLLISAEEPTAAMMRAHVSWSHWLDAQLNAHERFEIVAPTRPNLVVFRHTAADVPSPSTRMPCVSLTGRSFCSRVARAASETAMPAIPAARITLSDTAPDDSAPDM